MRSAEDIYKILTSQKTNYVIIEESICNKLSLNKGCRIKDLLDISNGHVSCCSFTFNKNLKILGKDFRRTVNDNMLYPAVRFFIQRSMC